MYGPIWEYPHICFGLLSASPNLFKTLHTNTLIVLKLITPIKHITISVGCQRLGEWPPLHWKKV